MTDKPIKIQSWVRYSTCISDSQDISLKNYIKIAPTEFECVCYFPCDECQHNYSEL